MLTALILALSVSGLSSVEVDQALAGQVPKHTESFVSAQGKSAGRGVGAIAIERPIAEVWATLSRYDDRTEYIPRLKQLTILERIGDRMRVHHEIDATVTTARYTAWVTLDAAAYTIKWKLDQTASDNTLKDVDGGYELVSISASRTLLVYRSYVDSGLHISAAIQNYVARQAIPDLLRAIKRRVESGGTWKR